MRSDPSNGAGGPPLAGPDQGVAPGQLVPGDARQVHRHPAPRLDPDLGPLEALQAPHPHLPVAPPAPATRHQLVVDRQRAAGQGAGDHGPRSPGGEDPVDPQAGPGPVDGGRGDVEKPVEGGPQVVDPLARGHVHLDHLGPLQERARDHVGQLQAGQLPGLGVDQAHLGEGHQTVADAQQLEDAQVLLGLGLPALGGGHYEQARLHRTHPGQHVLEKPDVAGHVDEGELAAGRERGPGEAEVDGEPPLLLLGETVGVHPGEGQDQGGLAVVDMAGGGDDVHLRATIERAGI